MKIKKLNENFNNEKSITVGIGANITIPLSEIPDWSFGDEDETDKYGVYNDTAKEKMRENIIINWLDRNGFNVDIEKFNVRILDIDANYPED